MYRAPLKDLQFVLHDLIGDTELQACRDLGDYSPDLADSVLAEAGRFAESVLDPLYQYAGTVTAPNGPRRAWLRRRASRTPMPSS